VSASSLPVERAGPDRLSLRLGPDERRILGSLVGELRAELEDPESAAPGGTLARLYPPAFPDDPEADAAYADLVLADLVETRRARVALVESTLEADEIDDRTAAAWLGAFNDLRLVLGTSLGVDDDDDGEAPDARDPDATRRAVYAYLGWLVAALVDALADALPPVPDEVA
jgi:Domain of unknown function (DUF2017)